MPGGISPAHIQVSGLEEYRAACRRAQVRTSQELTRALREIGTEMKRGIRSRMDRTFKLPRSERTGRLREDLHVRTGVDEMEIRFGEAQPQAGWWEFGGNSSSPPPLRERVPAGRTLYPTLREQRPDIELRMDLLLTKLGIEVENLPPTQVGG